MDAKGAKSSKMAMFLTYKPISLAPLAFLGELGGLNSAQQSYRYHDSKKLVYPRAMAAYKKILSFRT